MGMTCRGASLGQNLKFKVALAAERWAPREQTALVEALTTTRAKGGKRTTVCNEKTAAIHWGTMKQHLGKSSVCFQPSSCV